jgi:hypothetical protein
MREPLRYNATLLRMYWEMGIPRYLATVAKMLEDAPVSHAAEVSAPCGNEIERHRQVASEERQPHPA